MLQKDGKCDIAPGVLRGWEAWGTDTEHWLFGGEIQKFWEGLGSTTTSDGSKWVVDMSGVKAWHWIGSSVSWRLAFELGIMAKMTSNLWF